MVEAHRAGRSGQRDRAAEVRLVPRRVHRAAEIAVGVMVEHRAGMRARHHHQRAVLLRRVVQQHADCEHVVVGVRVEGPVLVPFDGRAVARGFQVDLRPVQPDPVRSQKLPQRGDQARGASEIPEQLMVLVRHLDPAHPGIARAVARLQVIDIGMGGDVGGGGDEIGDHPSRLADGAWVQQPLDQETPVPTIPLDLGLREHRRPPPSCCSGVSAVMP